MRTKILFSLLAILLFSSCMETKRKTNKTTSSSGNNNYGNDQYQYPDNSDNGNGHGDGNEDGVADGGQTQEYITLSNITLHGTGGANRYYQDGGPLWSSANQLGSSDQGIFYTNSRFNVRVRAQAGPGRNSYDSLGNLCQYIANPYKKLNINVCVRKSTGSCIYTHTFENVPVGQVSKVKEFTVSTTSDPLILEILSVDWDYACQDYLNQGYKADDPQLNGVCPMGLVWDTSCIKFDVQFSTDYTKDFPASAPRY